MLVRPASILLSVGVFATAITTLHTGWSADPPAGSQVTATNTHVPATNTRTSTPTGPTKTPPPTPSPGLDFAVGIDTNQDGVNDCGTGSPSEVGDGAPDAVAANVSSIACADQRGSTLTVNVYLMSSTVPYTNIDVFLSHPSALTQVSGAAPWLGCTSDTPTYGPNYVAAMCSMPAGGTYSDLGLVGQFTFTCTESGMLSLVHVGTVMTDDRATRLIDLDGLAHSEAGPDELTLACEPTLTPTSTPVGAPSSTPTRASSMKGDANCDRHVDSLDALEVLQQTAGLIASVRCQVGADVNHDGRISSLDAAILLQYGAGLIEDLPQTPLATATPTLTPGPTPTFVPYWVDCRIFCRLVLYPDVTCVQMPPGHAISTVTCTAGSGAWEMTCSTSGVTPRADCLHSVDGSFSCQAAPTRISGSCEGDAWFGACSSEDKGEGTDLLLHCWRTDEFGTENVDCLITDAYACTWRGGTFACEQASDSNWECRP